MVTSFAIKQLLSEGRHMTHTHTRARAHRPDKQQIHIYQNKNQTNQRDQPIITHCI